MVTAGASLLVTRFTTGTRLVDAPDDDYRAAAPRAHALFHAMTNRQCGVNPWSSSDDPVGASCTAFFAIAPRGPGLSVRYVANRRRQDGSTSPDVCTVERTATVDLGPLDQLDATVERRFGATMHRVLELTAQPATTR